MSNGLAFPESEAQIIIEYARKTGETAAEAIIDKVRDWLGHPDVVMGRAESWDPDAKRAIQEAKDDIVTARGELAAYWEGPAYDSFSIYMESLEKVFDNAQGVMTGMSDLLQQSRDTVTKTYQAAITFIGECAADILEAVGGILGTLKDWLGVLGEVAQLLANFVRNVTALENEALGIITEYGQTGLDLRQRATDLEVPSSMPPSAGISDNWDIRGQE